MQRLRLFIFIIIIPLFAFVSAHKFYVSVTQINYVEKEQALQIISRIFIDDLEKTLQERYGINPKFATKNELNDSDVYIKQYLNQRFKIRINDKIFPFHYLGQEYEMDVVKCYMEIEGIRLDTVKTISIENKILFDGFEDQQNIVHFKIKGQRKSFVLIKENDKGLLNL